GTFLLSGTAGTAPAWELTSRQNPDYPPHDDEDAYLIAGTTGSLGIPTMRLKVYPGARSWYEPFDISVGPLDRSDPLANQVAHFADVIRGRAEPVVSGRDGLKALEVVEAITRAAESGDTVTL